MQKVEVRKRISTIIFARLKYILVFVCFKRFGIQLQNVTRIRIRSICKSESEAVCFTLEQKMND